MNRPSLPMPSPKWLAAPLKFIPGRLASSPLEKTINHLFQQPLQEGEFDFLESRWIKLDITDMDLQFYLGFDGKRLLMDQARPCDATFKGDTKAFSELALRKADPDTLFFRRRLMVEGDTELGLGLKNLLASLDWENLPPPFRQFLNLGNKLRALSTSKAH